MRIVNANRSPNAVVWMQFPFHPSILKQDKLPLLRAALDKYAKERPRQWHSFAYCRVDKVDIEHEKLVITIGFQSRSSWQDLGRILSARADLMCFVLEWSKEYGVAYDEMPRRELLYYAGALKSGKVGEYRQALHNPDNIVDRSPEAGEEKDKENFDVDQTEANALFLSQLQQSLG